MLSDRRDHRIHMTTRAPSYAWRRILATSYNVTLEHVERERNYCSVAHELKVPFTAVDANGSKCSRARESRLVRLSKECKHEQHGRRVVATSFGVSEQSIFVGIILILVNGHPRGGVSAFFREISAFFLIQNFVKFHIFPILKATLFFFFSNFALIFLTQFCGINIQMAVCLSTYVLYLWCLKC